MSSDALAASAQPMALATQTHQLPKVFSLATAHQKYPRTWVLQSIPSLRGPVAKWGRRKWHLQIQMHVQQRPSGVLETFCIMMCPLFLSIRSPLLILASSMATRKLSLRIHQLRLCLRHASVASALLQFDLQGRKLRCSPCEPRLGHPLSTSFSTFAGSCSMRIHSRISKHRASPPLFLRFEN